MGLRVAALLASASILFCCQSAQKEEPKRTPAPTNAARAELALPGPGGVQDEVASAQLVAATEGRRVVVYVGATWCEPCKYFLESVKAGTLPATFANIRFLKFDHDADEERLSAAGYGGPMLPRFVVPGVDGAATDKRFEGSTKGPQAMDNIVPRLESILAPAARSAH